LGLNSSFFFTIKFLPSNFSPLLKNFGRILLVFLGHEKKIEDLTFLDFFAARKSKEEKRSSSGFCKEIIETNHKIFLKTGFILMYF